MDEDNFETIKKQQEFDRMFPNHPCKICMRRTKCNEDANGKNCAKWVEWFKAEWRKIRRKYK